MAGGTELSLPSAVLVWWDEVAVPCIMAASRCAWGWAPGWAEGDGLSTFARRSEAPCSSTPLMSSRLSSFAASTRPYMMGAPAAEADAEAGSGPGVGVEAGDDDAVARQRSRAVALPLANPKTMAQS